MKGKINIFITFIIIISITVTTVGCGNQIEDSNTNKTDADVVEEQDSKNEDNNKKQDEKGTEDENVTAKIEMPDQELDNKEITYYFWEDIDTRRSKEGEAPTAVDLFEQEYEGKIDNIITTHGEYWERLVALTISGDAPDFIFLPNWNWYPQALTNNVVECAEKYIDFNKPLWEGVAQSNENFKWEGKIYTPAFDERIGQWLYYNKPLFESYGLDTPRDYYERDEWTWDKLKELAVELTDDTDNDGEIDQWGFCSLDIPFIYVCGVPAVETTSDAYFKLKDPKIAKAMDFLHELGKGGLNVYGGYIEAMKKGKLGMYIFHTNGHVQDFREAWDRGEIEIAPIPKPTKDSTYVLPTNVEVAGIGNGCSNPEGAALLIELYRYTSTKEFAEKYETGRTIGFGVVDIEADLFNSPNLTEDQKQYHRELLKLPKVSTSWQSWYQERDLASGRVIDGEPWSKVVEEIYPEKQKLLESYFKDKGDE